MVGILFGQAKQNVAVSHVDVGNDSIPTRLVISFGNFGNFGKQ